MAKVDEQLVKQKVIIWNDKDKHDNEILLEDNNLKSRCLLRFLKSVVPLQTFQILINIWVKMGKI